MCACICIPPCIRSACLGLVLGAICGLLFASALSNKAQLAREAQRCCLCRPSRPHMLLTRDVSTGRLLGCFFLHTGSWVGPCRCLFRGAWSFKPSRRFPAGSYEIQGSAVYSLCQLHLMAVMKVQAYLVPWWMGQRGWFVPGGSALWVNSRPSIVLRKAGTAAACSTPLSAGPH